MSVSAVNMAVTAPRPRNARLRRSTAKMIRTTLYAAYKHIEQFHLVATIHQYHRQTVKHMWMPEQHHEMTTAIQLNVWQTVPIEQQ